MAKRLSAPHPIARIMALAAIMLLLLLGGMLVASGRQNAARCTGNCQACYCDVIEKRDGVDVCIVNGAASACIGCVGSCTSSDHCKAMPGVGGCGAYIAWVRDSDCLYTPPPETPDAQSIVEPEDGDHIRPQEAVERGQRHDQTPGTVLLRPVPTGEVLPFLLVNEEVSVFAVRVDDPRP